MSKKKQTTHPGSREASFDQEQNQTAEHAARDRAHARPDSGPAELDAPPSNTASNNSKSEFFKLLRFGVDSLYLSYQGELSYRVMSQLQHLKQLAQSENPTESAQAQFKVGDHVFEVKDKGSRLFAFVLEDNAFRVQLAKPGNKAPMAYVKVSAEYLAHVCPNKAEAALYALLNELGEVKGSANVSRIDLHADFTASWNMESWDRTAWVTRASKIDAYSVDNQFTGWSIGLGGPVGGRLYDKIREMVVSGKAWLIPLWQEVGWIPGDTVWRLEFEFKRDFVGQVMDGSFYTVMKHLNALWSYATTEWLRLTVPNPEDQTRSRWPIHPLWLYLSEIDWETKGGPLTRKFSNERSPKDDRLLSNGLGAVLSYMAKHGIDSLNDGIEDFFASAYSHHNRVAEFLGLPFDDYIAERLAVKRREYNTALNNPALLDEIDEESQQDVAKAYRKASDGE